MRPNTALDTESVAFVRVEDKQFFIGNDAYSYVGANFWHGAYLGADTESGNRARLIQELDQLSSIGVKNLRILGASERSILKNSLEPAFRDQTSNYNEALLEGLDFLLSEMSKRDMKAVIYLNNFWEWSGGMATYLYWSRAEIVDPSDPEKPWPAFAKFTAQFYADTDANELFRDYVKTLLGRVNSVTGQAYKDDPTIMSWQLANEPRPGFQDAQGQDTLPDFYKWIDETAGFIKRHAPYQLVSTGNEGRVGCIELPACYIAAHKTENIDYLTFHMWPKNWGWIDAKNMDETFPQATIKAKDYIVEHVEYANTLGKPIVLEEFGLERDGGLITVESSTKFRNQFYQLIFYEIEKSVKSGGPFMGSNFWSWGGQGRASMPNGRWDINQPNYTGDPPQEPQGLNSVFDKDISTLDIITQHAKSLERVTP